MIDPALDGTALGRRLKKASTCDWQDMLCTALRISQQDLPLPPTDISDISEVGSRCHTPARPCVSFPQQDTIRGRGAHEVISKLLFSDAVFHILMSAGGSSQGPHKICPAQSKAEWCAAP